MDSKKVILVSLAGVVAAPYLAAALTDPSGPLPEAPKGALQAISYPHPAALCSTQ
jgi:hypothetical protein